MNQTISIKGREPTPRIINVKQYSAGVDTVSFIFEEMPEGELSVASEVYRQGISAQGNAAEWVIPSEFTEKSGSFDIQLEAAGDDMVWRSDLMLLIVSESVDGSSAVSSGAGITADALTLTSGITDEGIIGDAEMVEEG